MLKELLQGKPFEHPLHPALVHMPVGLFVISLLFDVAGLLGFENGAPWFVEGAFYTMIGGVVTALLAAIPGLVDWSAIRSDRPAKRTATLHMILNIIVVGLYALNLGLRATALDQTVVPIFPFILSLVSVGILSFSGYLGGLLVYEQGIAVGRHRRDTELPDRTFMVTVDEAVDGLVPITAADSLGERETLRVDLAGTVMTIAKIGGEVYAFQEFCSHRFGPLSEGSFHNGDIQCPWHGSCFDVRTGKVTNGPAKVDLKTYEVTVQDGMIQVRVPHEVYTNEHEKEQIWQR